MIFKNLARYSLVCLLASVSISHGNDTYVHGYTKKDGTYVLPYYRTKANKVKTDNYDCKGSVNYHTGKFGTKNCQEGNLKIKTKP